MTDLTKFKKTELLDLYTEQEQKNSEAVALLIEAKDEIIRLRGHQDYLLYLSQKEQEHLSDKIKQDISDDSEILELEKELAYKELKYAAKYQPEKVKRVINLIDDIEWALTEKELVRKVN